MSRSLGDVLAVLDELEAPDLWDDIEARSQLPTPSSEPTPGAFGVDLDHGETSAPSARRKLLVAAAGAVVAVVVAVVALVNAGGDEQGGVDTVDSPESVDAGAITVVPNPFPGPYPGDGSFDRPLGPEVEVGEVIDVSGQVTRVLSDIEPAFDDQAAIASFSDLVTDGAGSDWVGAYSDAGHSGYLVRLDSATGQVVATIEIGTGSWVSAPVVGEGAVWIVRHEERVGYLVRVDPATGQVVATIEIGTANVNDPVIADGAVWVKASVNENGPTYRGALYRVDPATNTVVAIVDFPPFRGDAWYLWQSSSEMVASVDAVWVMGHVEEWRGKMLFRVDPETNAVVAVIEFGDALAGRGAIAVAEDALWVGGSNGVLYRVDKSDNTVEAIDLGIRTEVLGLVVADDAVWTTTVYSVYRIDPTTNTFDVLDGPAPDVPQAVPGIDFSGWNRLTGDLVLTDDALFVLSDNPVGSVNNRPIHLLRIDSSSLSLDAAYFLAERIENLYQRPFDGLAVVDDMLWIGSYRLPLAAVSGSPAG